MSNSTPPPPEKPNGKEGPPKVNHGTKEKTKNENDSGSQNDVEDYHRELIPPPPIQRLAPTEVDEPLIFLQDGVDRGVAEVQEENVEEELQGLTFIDEEEINKNVSKK